MRDPTVRTVLCPTDFSIGSEEALRYAIYFARAHGAKLKLVHVDDYASFGLPGEGPLVEDRHTRLWAKLDELAARYRSDDVEIETDLLHGNAYEAIVEYTGLADVDLVVLGTHGRTGLSRMLLGSVAERVVRTCRVPVVTVRHPEYAAPRGGGLPIG